ncbi:hypothetical protein TNCV_4759341 [Trichonephila clavipes]|nr:hypothetical protein TNCV_4759341 [Trichonephila clavipes]
MFDGLAVFAVDRWLHDSGTRRVRFISRPESPMKEGRLVLGTFRSERMRVLNRSHQDDRLRVMLVLVHIDITPPQPSQEAFSMQPSSCQFLQFLVLKIRLFSRAIIPS